MNNYHTLDEMVTASTAAFETMSKIPDKNRAMLLRDMASEIEAIGDELLEMASIESNLPVVRFQGERARTCGQLRMFADLIEEGSWLDVQIDTAIPDRMPLPKPDLRSYKVPIGPILVFGASNFPLAYSTAGGDTASAIAAGCPVICKMHPAHPKTSSMVASAIQKALAKNLFPSACFIHFEAADFAEVKALVQHPGIQGVGFTGSVTGGMSIYEYARERQQPIPVFTEMGSVNPVILLPHGLASSTEVWVDNYAGAITMGVGQFCTNPGLMFGIESGVLHDFMDSLADKISKAKAHKMLHEGIYANYEKRKEEVLHSRGVITLSRVQATRDMSGSPTLAKVSSAHFRENPRLHEEVFGPFSLIVVCTGIDDLRDSLSLLNGQLTLTIIAGDNDEQEIEVLRSGLVNKAGRLIFNGVPTGVEVCNAMVHGGPFPATTDSRFTAVGNNAIYRWVRPVSFQNWPNKLLPPALQNENDGNIWRNVNGKLTKEALT
ncbi:MAG: aldehyde dehydrogenase (NADP(+)) [Saprospiraceae bacterium]|nr:aldehyde dehydrogenase (NADP(+)) [Saprospiraceae bacterium]